MQPAQTFSSWIFCGCNTMQAHAMSICHDVSMAVVILYGAMPHTPLYVGKWSFAFWSVCTSILLLPQPPSFWPLIICVFSAIYLATWFFAYNSGLTAYCLHLQQSIYQQTRVVLVGILYLLHHTITSTHRAGHLLISCARVEWGSLQQICHSSLGCYCGIKDTG